MNAIKEILDSSRKILIKLGSSTLTAPDGRINHFFMQKIAGQCAALIERGKQICLVSSGAQVAGVSTIDRWARKRDIHYRQALCAIGQVELMDNWRTAFAAHGLHIGQLLLTKEDFLDEHRSLNIRNTLFTLVDEGAIPIINENDSVCCDEIRIGDNDNLSALSAILWSADALILLSDVDGVYDKNPRDADAKFIERVDDIALLRGEVFIGSPGELGTGGIETKIEAAEKVCAYGIPLILADGRREDCIDILTSDSPSVARLGTLFSAK